MSTDALAALLSTVGRSEARMTVTVVSPESDMLEPGAFESGGGFDVARTEAAFW